MGKTLKQMLLEAGYPKEEMFHHDSDLYVFATPLTMRVINEYCDEHNFNREWHCPMFKDRITGQLMYDCAFQYYEEVYEKWFVEDVLNGLGYVWNPDGTLTKMKKEV